MAKLVDYSAYKDSLEYHKMGGVPGKISMVPTKPLMTQEHLSRAYSPGVAGPCYAIHENPMAAYDYTSKGNMVAVISNGTAILGLGNLGPAASKPVMEGKAVLFKRFANVDSIDIEVTADTDDKFVAAVAAIGDSFGGINLEDISSPSCFNIERRLKEMLDIPVFHDDQHGTAIITAAALLNAVDITRRDLRKLKIVVNGSGAAGIACIELMKLMGVPHDSVIACDQYGVIYSGREHNMNPWKAKHAVDTKDRTLSDAMKDADVFLGLSVKDALTPEMLSYMRPEPIIFAMANPDPEIRPEVAIAIRPDAIIATGRSDYPNQVNNVMGFPYIFRGALDVRASAINDEMKIAAAKAIAQLAREPVHDDVFGAYSRRDMQYGKNYIIPVPFDPRLISTVAPAVAKAAIDSGVARVSIEDWVQYGHSLDSMFNPSLNVFGTLYDRLKKSKVKSRVIFAEGEEEKIIKVALAMRSYIKPILVGDIKKVSARIDAMGIKDTEGLEVINAAVSEHNEKYIDHMYARLQRRGYLRRDCIRDVKNDRNIFASCMLACGDGDALITGLTRSYSASLRNVHKVIKSKGVMFGFSMVMSPGRTVCIADTSVHSDMNSETMAEVAVKLAGKVRSLGMQPRVAFTSYSSFGNMNSDKSVLEVVSGAMKILSDLKVDFEYDGPMAADVALNKSMLDLYSFSGLTDVANILIMPNIHSANISYKLLKELGSASVFGPVIVGTDKSFQVINLNSSIVDIQNLVIWAAAEVNI